MLAKIVVIYEGEPKEKRFAVRDSLADELIKVLEEGKRFWEWEKEIASLSKMNKAFMNREHSDVDYKVLLKKYMEYVLVEEGTDCVSFERDEWVGYTEAEYSALRKISQELR